MAVRVSNGRTPKRLSGHGGQGMREIGQGVNGLHKWESGMGRIAGTIAVAWAASLLMSGAASANEADDCIKTCEQLHPSNAEALKGCKARCGISEKAVELKEKAVGALEMTINSAQNAVDYIKGFVGPGENNNGNP